MINISQKENCCGCSACVQICPKHCIRFVEDKEGFLYPGVDESLCIDCGMCEKVCPVIHQDESRQPLKVYAAKHNDDEIRMKSSSGGIFTLLAEQVIDEGGVVFGARFDEYWEVMHDYTETKEGLAAFRGSKYVQSRIGTTYRQAESFLKAGRKVLFTGTPCQIAGLKRFLRKEYGNLLAVDFVCHGVPSPKVWRMYLDETIARQGVGKNSVLSHAMLRKKFIRSIDFRSKSTGWKKFSFALTLTKAIADGEENTVLLSDIFYENMFMNVFLSNLCLRPSCYACPAKSGKSGADITIGDFWGIEKHMPDFDDDKGCGLCLLHNEKVDSLLKAGCELKETTKANAVKDNSSIECSVPIPVNRNYFFYEMQKSDRLEETMHKIVGSSPIMRLRRLIYRKIGL